MMSLYAEYIKEREGKHCIEVDGGFITLQNLEKHCYFIDIYVKPELRHSGIAKQLTDKAVEYAQQQGYAKALGSVVPSAPYATYNLSIMLKYGFKIHSSERDIIYLEKEI